jgi:hypothetical protein
LLFVGLKLVTVIIVCVSEIHGGVILIVRNGVKLVRVIRVWISESYSGFIDLLGMVRNKEIFCVIL